MPNNKGEENKGKKIQHSPLSMAQLPSLAQHIHGTSLAHKWLVTHHSLSLIGPPQERKDKREELLQEWRKKG